MEHVFWMDRDFKAQLCLWAPSCPINLAKFWYKIQAWLEPPNHLIHYRKGCVNHYTTWMTGGDEYNFWQKYRRKTSKLKWHFASNLIWSILQALQGLGSTRFTPGLQLQRQLNYTKRLVLDVVSNAQNWALKTRKMYSKPKYNLVDIWKVLKKILQTIDPINFKLML